MSKITLEIKDNMEDLAIFMHEEYEIASRDEGWDTQKKCRVPFHELPKENQTVMLKVADAVIKRLANKIEVI